MSPRKRPKVSPHTRTRVDAVTVDYADGLDRQRVIEGPDEADRAALDALDRRLPEAVAAINAGHSWTFDGCLADAEAYWRAQPATASAAVEPFTPDWYRRDILRRITQLRAVVQGHRVVSVEAGIVMAIKLGGVIQDATWRLNRGDATRTGRKVSRGQQRATAEASASRRHTTRHNEVDFRRAVAIQARKRPSASNRAIAQSLFREYGGASGRGSRDPQRQLAALTRRVSRVRRNK